MKVFNKYSLMLLVFMAFAIGANAQCSPILAPTTVETFAGGATPACWTQSATTGGPWIFINNPGYAAAGTQSHTADGSHFAWVDFSGTDDDVILDMVEVDVSALTTPALVFWLKSYYTIATSASNELHIEASDGAGNWTSLAVIQQNDPAWQMQIIDLSTSTYGANIVQVRFRADRDPAGGTFFYNDLLIDDVQVTEAPTCFAPTNFVGGPTGTGYNVDLSWTGSATTPATNGYTIEYGPAGFTPGTGTTVTTMNTSDSITGLTACTTYQFYLTAECGTGDFSFTVGPINVLTPAGIIAAPYNEKFFDATIPGCWTQNQTAAFSQWKFTGNPYFLASVAPVTTSHTADGSHFAWIDMSSTLAPRYMTMPEVDISTLPSAALSFWMWSNASFNANSAQNTLIVEASDGAGNWNPVTTINQDAMNWQFKLYDLSSYTYNGSIVQIRFNAVAQSATGTTFYNDIALDDIKIDAMPTAVCVPQMAPDTLDFEDGGILNACWEQGDSTMDNLDWTVTDVATPSTGSGPTGPANGSYYAFIEASPTAVGDSAILMSPPINTATLVDAPAIYFNYHMFGNDAMTLRVEYEIFGSDSWETVWEQVGQVQSTNADPFESAYVPLPNAIGSLIRVRFIAITGENGPGSTLSWASDVAIDDVVVANVLANDVTVTNVITPGNNCGLGIQPITVEVTNRGFNDQSNVPVFVSVDGGNPVGATLVGPIAGNNGTATVDVLIDMSALGNHSISVMTALTGDEVPDNDMMMASAYHQPQITGEYSAEYEMTNDYWYGDGAWEHGAPAATVINSAGGGMNAYVTNLTGNYADGQTSYLYSPCFDLSAMTQPLLRFSINWDIEDDWDGAWLEYSIGGTGWTKLGANDLSGQNWYTDSVTQQPIGWVWNGTGTEGSQGWVDAIIDLQPYGVTISQDVRFRFAMFADAGTNNEGLGIDNFGIFDSCIDPVDNETIVNESKDGQADGSITLNPIGGLGTYTYLWSDGSTMNSLSGLAPGTYMVTITDPQSCTTMESYEVISLCPASLGLTTTMNPEIGDDEDNGAASVIATGGVAPYTYTWSNGATTDQNTSLAGGNTDYTVVVTDATGCTDQATVTVGTVYMVGTESLEGLTGLVLSPNPAKDYAQLNINFENAVDLSVRLVDVTGRVLETRNAGSTTTEEMRFDVSNLAEGVYFMQITANNQTATKRFVVVK